MQCVRAVLQVTQQEQAPFSQERQHSHQKQKGKQKKYQSWVDLQGKSWGGAEGGIEPTFWEKSLRIDK